MANQVLKSGVAAIAPPQHVSVASRTRVNGWYARYVLGVLVLVYVINFIDRQILAILAEDIKADLGVSDAQLGFLFGTAFAVFYATFGVAFGRLADVWNRKKLITVGLGFWSLMTVASGLTRSFLPLAFCRFGVGIGEASATPAAFSMLYDYFSPKVRTTVLSIYSGGVYIGMGLGLFLGGSILEAWAAAWPHPAQAPFGLRGWQVAFMVVGLPGLIMALWVSTLREPVRGHTDGIISDNHPRPLGEMGVVLISMLPVANWVSFYRQSGQHNLAVSNAAAATLIAVISLVLAELTGDILQWMALAVGVYAAVSWAQGLALRDPVVFGMMFRCRTLTTFIFAGASWTFTIVGIGFWAVPFFQRYHNVSAGETGAILGLAMATMGFVGIIVGGILADRLRLYTPKGKLIVWLGSVSAALVSSLLFLTAQDVRLAYFGFFVLYLTGTMAHGPAVSTVNDLMLPRGRATVSAFAFMISTFGGAALGPYVTGHISDIIAVGGASSGEALRQAMLWTLLLPLTGILFVSRLLRHIADDEESLITRARALGEKI
ncbi:MFS transporter [Altererythrobacter sp.]|uniref:MFS transporter n=1 Tax=Altererythrobacter sp. TaxID=1872480 RepID=UPI003CFD0451